jgi:hypothetical protein
MLGERCAKRGQRIIDGEGLGRVRHTALSLKANEAKYTPGDLSLPTSAMQRLLSSPQGAGAHPMVALSGQRTQFTWALNEYNKSDDPSVRARFVRHMAASIRNAMAAGFSQDGITRGKSYPAEEVQAALSAPDLAFEADVPEAQVKESLQNSVDSTNARRKGAGGGSVYAYGYRCAPDRMKVGYTEGDTIERIAAQIGTSTPDKPVLFFEVRTDRSRALERALHAILVYRGKKVTGGGDEWFLTSVDEIERLYDTIAAGV